MTQNKEIQQQFELLHKQLVDTVAAFCFEHQIVIDEFILRTDGFETSCRNGAWNPTADSCLSLFKNGQKKPVMESF